MTTGATAASITMHQQMVFKFMMFGVPAIFILIGIGLFTVAGKSLLLVLIAAELFYIPQPIVFLVVLMIITDSVEYGQWKLGHRDESLAL